MAGAKLLFLLVSVYQVVCLICDYLPKNPVEVAILFRPFPSTRDAESFSVGCSVAGDNLVHMEPFGRSACSPDCEISLQLPEDPRGYNITLTAVQKHEEFVTKSFLYVPVLHSSLQTYTTATTALLKWNFQKRQSLSTLSLYNARTRTLARVININSTETRSQRLVEGLQPGTHFEGNITVTTFLKDLSITLKQIFRFYLKTANCHASWWANGRSCYAVRRTGLARSSARQSCDALAAGSHLANLKTKEDLLFVTSQLLRHGTLLLLWTGLSVQQTEDQPVWTDGSRNHLANTETSSLPASQANCFALQMNATVPGYFLIPFFCSIPLPFICQYQIPPVLSLFSLEVVKATEQEIALRWTDLSALNLVNDSHLEVFLLYAEEGWPGNDESNGILIEDGNGSQPDGFKRQAEVSVALSCRGVNVTGLSPGGVYSFTLQASHPAGATWSLGQTRTAYTRPLPPQNITITLITECQFSLRWMLPDSRHLSRWRFVVRYTDASTMQERIIGTANISRSSAVPGLHAYTATIGGLKSYKKYIVGVYTLTQHGIMSCEQAPLTVRTAVTSPSGLVVSRATSDNLTVCWTSPPDDPPDGYYITAHPLNNFKTSLASTLWINDSSPDTQWGNNSVCRGLGGFTPGETYEVGAVAFKGDDISRRTSLFYTADPMPVQIAVPLSVGTNSALLYVQPPQTGVIDGVKVCPCPEVCDHPCEGFCTFSCDWHSIDSSNRVLTLGNLSSGWEYRLAVYSTSRRRTGAPFFTRRFKTSLAPPGGVREGAVTESSVELLWDRARGQALSYEVVCFNCHRSLAVQKVRGQSAVFSRLIAGRMFYFAVRTEKESFADSSPVTINITAAPSPVVVALLNKTASSICIRWNVVRGEISGFILTIQNMTSYQERIICQPEVRSYAFHGLAPGCQYTIEVISASGERRSKPASINPCTIPEIPREVTLAEDIVTSVFVTWKPPQGQVDGYKLVFGRLSSDRKSWKEMIAQGTSFDVRGLIPGSDYGVDIQSVRGSGTSQAVHKVFSTRPAGLCFLRLDHINTTSVSVSWGDAVGEFDFHRVTVTNISVTITLTVPKEDRVAMVTGLVDGCSYNVSAERVRGVTVGSAAFLAITTVPARVRGVRVFNVSARAFSIRWQKTAGCVDHYQVDLLPNHGNITMYTENEGYIQADVVNVSPGTQYTLSVTAVSSSHFSPGVSRTISTNESVPGPPLGLKGKSVGSNGIVLSWTMPPDLNNIDRYIIRYKEMCPYPDPKFKQVTRHLDTPETLLTDLTSGSTYHIQVAAFSPAGLGAFSKAVYIKTAESPPGLVTTLTATAQNHTFVQVTWFLPHRTNGLITKFAIKVKHLSPVQTVRILQVNAEDIMTGALPHCNDAADILSRATLSPLEITASSTPITLSAVPPAASWSVPISVGVDQLRPFTSYLFEVSAFTSDGEGQIASTMVRMPESAPEDPPQNFSIANMTSRSISISWNSPKIITGKFTYMVYLYGPKGYLYEENTGDMRFSFTGLTPYTKYMVAVRAKAAGEVGPAAQNDIITPAEAPGAVQNLMALSEDSFSIRVSWRRPAQPNGPITQYRVQVLEEESLLQDIILTVEANITTATGLDVDETPPPDQHDSPGRRKRNAELSPIASLPTFVTAVSDATHYPGTTASDLTDSGLSSVNHPTNSNHLHLKSTVDPTIAEKPTVTDSDEIRWSAPAASETPDFIPTTLPPATLPPWLTKDSKSKDITSDPPRSSLTPNQLRFSTRHALVTGLFSTRSTAFNTTDIAVREEVLDALSKDLSYLVSDLNPFTEYTLRVSASTTVGEGPATDITEKTREQAPGSVSGVSYQNISSTSILLRWEPPLNPNGRITHYTVYGLELHSERTLKWVTNSTSILISDLDKYTCYKVRVAASTAVGESSLSEKDDIFVFTLEDEPDSPPVNLTVEDVSPSTATLVWSAPEKANGVIQHYTVLYVNESYSASVNTSVTRATLTKLKPFTYYSVSVMAYTRYGHGNQVSETLYLLSGEDVPGGPPHDLTYESVSPSEVNVTWLPPAVPNGVIIYYSLQLWNSTHYLNLTSSTNSVHIAHLRKYATYRVTVQSHTRAGPGNYSSEPLNITTLEDAPDTPPQFLLARKLSDYEVELSWQPPLEGNSDILYYVVRVWNETTDVWQNVTETSMIVNVDPESHYKASVASWTKFGDGGMRTRITFTTADAEPYDPPQNVSFANLTASSVTVLWHPPTEPNGAIIHYTIYYSHNNTVTEQKVPIAGLSMSTTANSALSFTLTGLIGGTNYSIWMTSSTAQGDGGVRSTPHTLLLPEDVPNDSVHNLTAQIFSSTVIIISWDPPLEPNGRPYYLLTLQEAGIPPQTPNQGPHVVNKTIRQTTTDNVFLFTKLRKFFPYVLTVTPATGAGPAYNHTSTMYLRTDDDVPGSTPLLVSTRNLSSTSIAVDWQRPLEANGEITEYILMLYGPGGIDATHTPNTSFNLMNLLPYTSYNLTISAATRKGAGPVLQLQLHTDEGGPMSPPRNLTIYNYTAVSVWLSWEPPLEPNGVVIQYGFRIQDLITHTITHRNSSGLSTTEYLPGFRPHSSYEISVCSYTRVGHGNQFSIPVTFTTNESVSDAVGNLSCLGVSWDSVQLSWDLPANPNGQILFYEILVDVDSQSREHQANTSKYTVMGLIPEQEYTFTVAAINSAGAGERINCSASTLSESVPSAPHSLTIAEVTPTNVTLGWAPPLSIPGVLKEYHVFAQLLSTVCETDALTTAQPDQNDDCVDSNITVSVNASYGAEENLGVTLHSLLKYRYYRFRVAAVTKAGMGEYTAWEYTRTLAGHPDDPPQNLKVTSTSSSFHIAWDSPAVLAGPTSYLVQVEGPGMNHTFVRAPGEMTAVILTNLTAFTRYLVTITAFTGHLEYAERDGKAIGPIEFQTLEEEPKDPPKNVVISIIPDEVNRLHVTFTPPEEPNGQITAYYVHIYEKDTFVKNASLNITEKDHNVLSAVIEGLKGGHSYSIQISAKNGAGRSPPSPQIQITTGIKAPAKPTQRPQAVLGHRGVAMVTHRSITIRMPACFYSDDNGPIAKIQVIVAESGVKDIMNVTTWKNAYFDHPAPYLTDGGFPNPTCASDEVSRSDTHIREGRSASGERRPAVKGDHTSAQTYVIGEQDDCTEENRTKPLCNGPLRPNTVYVFKFRATNIIGQYTDSDYSDHVKTAAEGLLTRDEQIILGVLLSFFLAVLLIIVICGSVKIHQRKKEGGTYSPREAEIIETKCKLDQLIAVADLELRQEKLNRYSSFFFRRKEIYVIQLLSYRKSLKPVNKKSFLQHVEDLCANDNSKFQEEFAELPKLLQDMATTDADLPWNKSKNRFPNIKPYNNNRVKLLSEAGTAGSDYINASFVSGYLCPNEFIATQGPLPGTVADFWRMIWETGTRTIAMLTQCYEKGRIRCHKYWPEDNKPMSVFSDILISKVSEEILPDWTVRTLKVEKHGHYILVRHFNYTSWPEHGVPESCSTFIKFVKAVRAHRHDNATIAVHCSAGVGRTGVFIALDHLVQHVRDHDFVDIYGLVAELRSERMCMVQNMAQYIFLHQSMLELLNNKGNSQSIWFVSYSALEKMDSLDAMEGDVELEWEETTM